jgi:hypothetical protein
MVQEMVEWFGDYTADPAITVSTVMPPPPPPDDGTTQFCFDPIRKKRVVCE